MLAAFGVSSILALVRQNSPRTLVLHSLVSRLPRSVLFRCFHSASASKTKLKIAKFCIFQNFQLNLNLFACFGVCVCACATASASKKLTTNCIYSYLLFSHTYIEGLQIGAKIENMLKLNLCK